MSKSDLRIRALALRKCGNSIGDIATDLGVSKSTVSYWCRNIELSARAQARIASRSHAKSTKYLLAAAEEQRAARLRREATARMRAEERLGECSQRDLLLLGLGLYWGEGYKAGSQELGFTNSDPGMIRVYLRWLESVFGVTADRIVARVSINAEHSHRIGDVESYWSRVTSIPHTQFSKPSFIHAQSKKLYADSSAHMGTLRVKVRGGTELRREILAFIAQLGQEYGEDT